MDSDNVRAIGLGGLWALAVLVAGGPWWLTVVGGLLLLGAFQAGLDAQRR